MRKAQEFEAKAKERNITRWHIRDCSLCGYQLAYLIQGSNVAFDSGCDCITRGPVISERSVEHIADHYNMQKNADVIKEMDAFWGFNDDKQLTLEAIPPK